MTLKNIFSANAEVAAVVTALKEDGYAVIENLLDCLQLQSLENELQPYLEQTEVGNEDFWGHRTKRFGALLKKSKTVQDMLIHPKVLAVADEILLPYCATYWANYTGVMHLGVGEAAQALHRDTNLWPFTNPMPPLTLATMWAVNDFTKENGGTLIIPGSHLWDDARVPQPHEIEATEMPAGSVLLYSGNVIHGGGANRSNGVRYGVALHYVLGWLRQEENQLLTMTVDEARTMPEPVQRLMGYALGASALGVVDHMDPFTFLTGKKHDGPRALSSEQLDAAEKRMNRFTVTVGPGARNYFKVVPEEAD